MYWDALIVVVLSAAGGYLIRSFQIDREIWQLKERITQLEYQLKRREHDKRV